VAAADVVSPVLSPDRPLLHHLPEHDHVSPQLPLYADDTVVHDNDSSAGALHRSIMRLLDLGLPPRFRSAREFELTADRLYGNIYTVRTLLLRGILYTGVIKANAAGLPKELTEQPLLKGQWISAFAEPRIAVTALHDSVPLVFISSAVSPAATASVMRARNHKIPMLAPAVQKQYNSTMGNVDKRNKAEAIYGTRRRSVRWWLIPFHTINDYTVCNAWLIHQALSGKLEHVKDQKKFRMELATELIGKFRCRKRKGRSNKSIELCTRPHPAHDFPPVVVDSDDDEDEADAADDSGEDEEDPAAVLKPMEVDVGAAQRVRPNWRICAAPNCEFRSAGGIGAKTNIVCTNCERFLHLGRCWDKCHVEL
jgi:hypothetical protein